MTRKAAAGVTCVAGLSLAFACGPIQGAPPSLAPTNTGCTDDRSCEVYDVKGTKAKLLCNKGRCEFGRPEFVYTMVVSVPDSSLYAPGRTFVLSSAELNPQSGVPPRSTCILPSCVQLPELNRVEGKYKVTSEAAKVVGFPLAEDTSLPVRVSYIPLIEGSSDEAGPRGIPLDPLLTSSRVIRTQAPAGSTKGITTDVKFIDALPIGPYQRIAYPQPPYDQYFPPIIGPARVSAGPPFIDEFTLGKGDFQLDDVTGLSRTATVTRAEGLEGWQVWLADGNTGRRISTIHTLSGKKMVVRLDTVTPNGMLGDKVDVIVAPPDGYLAVPRLQSPLVNGQGLELLEVPTLQAPASVGGVVAHGESTALTGIPGRLTFTSTGLRLPGGKLQPLLKYSTSVSTDETGNFKTVLPPGIYDVTVEPAEGTGFSKVKSTFDTAESLTKTYLPPPRTITKGRVLLADGRPLGHADVLALPAGTPVASTGVKPRPARTRTDDDGTFLFEADQGQYVLIVDPQAGSGFPRLVQLGSPGTGMSDLGDIQIGPPARLSFKLREPNQLISPILNPIVRALVRIYAELPNRGPPAVEIGRAMTDADGNCEILLAQQPR